MSKPRSRTLTKPDEAFRTVRGFTTAIHFGKQEKHLPGRRGFAPGNSPITVSIQRLQSLVERFAGTGEWVSPHKEIVDFGEIIGKWRDRETGREILTSRGAIHYSKSGAHVVPSHPEGRRK